MMSSLAYLANGRLRQIESDTRQARPGCALPLHALAVRSAASDCAPAACLALRAGREV